VWVKLVFVLVCEGCAHVMEIHCNMKWRNRKKKCCSCELKCGKICAQSSHVVSSILLTRMWGVLKREMKSNFKQKFTISWGIAIKDLTSWEIMEHGERELSRSSVPRMYILALYQGIWILLWTFYQVFIFICM
jgi:hypothetical protein